MLQQESGTLTFYEPDTNMFMSLGHGITDIDTEQIVEIANGELVTANIISINKGEKGKPGEIRGTIDNGYEIGDIYKKTILCQLDNSGPKEYKIEIEKIYISNNEDNKSMLIKITDESLIEKTGGIIQGMSGAPIMQNGKFIGAITNVLVNDPTQGYAIFGDMMIKQMREI